jgi:hypothetical protein
VSDGYRSLGGDFESYGAWDVESSLPAYPCDSIPVFEPQARRIGVRVTLEAPNPPAGFTPLTIIKAYTPSHEPGGAIGATSPDAAPVMAALPATTDALVGQPLVIELGASDANGDWVDFSVAGLPPGASFTTKPAFGSATSRTTMIRLMPCRPLVDLAPPSPPGPYSGFETVTVAVQESCGLSLNLSWSFETQGGAAYSVVSGCQFGPRASLARPPAASAWARALRPLPELPSARWRRPFPPRA